MPNTDPPNMFIFITLCELMKEQFNLEI